MDLIADIGGTNSRCALIDDSGAVIAPRVFRNSDFDSLQQVLGRYLDDHDGPAPSRGALAVAGPILGERVQMTNIDWSFSSQAVAEELRLTEVIVVNDFEAVARSLPALPPSSLLQIGSGKRVPDATLAVLGPGTGLGIATLVPGADGWAAVSGEGGHATATVVTALEMEVASRMREATGDCVAEDLLSGPGIENIHAALAGIRQVAVPDRTAANIAVAADAGDELAVETLAMFFALLGTAAGNLALTVGARGGVFIAGGILPRMPDALARSDFRRRFEDKRGYGDYLRAIPTLLITEAQPAFLGLREVLRSRSR